MNLESLCKFIGYTVEELKEMKPEDRTQILVDFILSVEFQELSNRSPEHYTPFYNEYMKSNEQNSELPDGIIDGFAPNIK